MCLWKPWHGVCEVRNWTILPGLAVDLYIEITITTLYRFPADYFSKLYPSILLEIRPSFTPDDKTSGTPDNMGTKANKYLSAVGVRQIRFAMIR